MNTSYLPNNDARNIALALMAKHGLSIHENQLNQSKHLKINRKDSRKIQALFSTYWPAFKSIYQDKLRPSITDNIEKMIKCHDLSFGYIMHECPNCDNFYLSGLSCHSRFCSSCNQKYREDRTVEIKSKLIKANHRHFVFTIPSELRKYFRIHRKLLDTLFSVVNLSFVTLIRTSKKRKEEKWTPGLVSIIHTFGRDLKWNPHIHVLVAEKVFDSYNKFHKYSYFHFDSLKKIFMYQLLNHIYAYLKVHDKKLFNEFIPLSKYLVKNYPHGFYTFGPELEGGIKNNTRLSIKAVVDYIARYASHPPIAESRILNIDEEKNLVTWVYTPHEDDHKSTKDKIGPQEITEPVFDFMKRLIVHIPDKHFHLIRYYGFYANHSSIDTSTHLSLYDKSYLTSMRKNFKWERMLLAVYKFSPLICSCGYHMKVNLDSSYLPKNGGPT